MGAEWGVECLYEPPVCEVQAGFDCGGGLPGDIITRMLGGFLAVGFSR